MPLIKGQSSKLRISAITWNMGNEGASKKIVKEFISQIIFEEGERPHVLAIATQEEMAPTGKRLQDLILKELNKDLPEREQYEIVQTKEPQFHTTMAGANHSFVTLTSALLTTDNRVSCAVFVKKPLKVEKAHARIDFEPGKEKGNKSLITIKGMLVGPGNDLLNFAVSGGHLNAQSELKRRQHAHKFLETERLLGAPYKDFEELYQEASALKILMGDFNERDRLMKTGEIVDEMRLTAFSECGFDVELQPELSIGERNLHGTYGFKFNEGAEQIKNMPDGANREHVATGGYLDRVAYSSGLTVDNVKYGSKLQEKYFKLNNRGRWCYHHADHVPVVRNLEIYLPTPDKRIEIVGQYISRCVPRFQDERSDFIFLLHKCKTLDDLKKRAESLLYHDSMLSPLAFLQQISGVDKDDFAAISQGLQQKCAQKETLLDLKIQMQYLIGKASKDKDKKLLENIYQSIARCNELRNAMQEVAALSHTIMSDEKKSAFMKIATDLVDLYYIESISELLHKPQSSSRLEEVEARMNEFLYHNAGGHFDNFADIKNKHFNLFEKKANKN